MTRNAGFVSVTHGQCAVNGAHEPGSKYAAECPLWRRQRRSEAAVRRPPSETPWSTTTAIAERRLAARGG